MDEMGVIEPPVTVMVITDTGTEYIGIALAPVSPSSAAFSPQQSTETASAGTREVFRRTGIMYIFGSKYIPAGEGKQRWHGFCSSDTKIDRSPKWKPYLRTIELM